MAESMVREFKVSIQVLVEDPNKPENQAGMDKLCSMLFTELKAIARSLDRGSKRLTITHSQI